jgi:hypothetical protein
MKRLALLAPLLLTACGPQYSTTYQIVPPQSQADRACANNCLVLLNQCQSNCQSNVYMCEAINTAARSARGDVFVGGSCGTRSCNANCQANYRICHTNCGGQVIQNTVCTANCGSARF